MPTIVPIESKPKFLPSNHDMGFLGVSFNNSFASDSLMIYSFPFADGSLEKFFPSNKEIL